MSFLFVLLATLSQGKPLWGNDGHKLTAYIAQELLDSAVEKRCQEILGEEYLSSVATWADQVKHETAYKWSSGLHFINTPDWACNYNETRDWGCAEHSKSALPCNVAGAVQNYSERLLTETGTQQQEALKFLIHYVGDIHQPLHVAFASDLGGNTQKGTYEPLNATSTLHGIWDYEMIDEAMLKYDSYWLDWAPVLLDEITAGDIDKWSKCSDIDAPLCPAEWGSTTAKAACDWAYVDMKGNYIQNGFSVGEDYYQRNIPVVKEFLQMGGVRLAAVLNYLLS